MCKLAIWLDFPGLAGGGNVLVPESLELPFARYYTAGAVPNSRAHVVGGKNRW